LEDSKQSYPPGFAIFLALLPQNIIKKYYWLISPLLDSMISLIGMVIIYSFTKDFTTSILTGIGYIFCYAAIRETSTMTSRQLGILLLSFTVLTFGLYLYNGINYYLYISLFVGFILIMTHKLSFQSLWFVLPVSSIILSDYKPVAFLIGLIVVTSILSFGGFFRVLREHFDILRFWYRNNKLIFAHQVYESKIYHNPKWERKKKRYPDSLMRILYIYGRRIFVYNPFAIISLFVIFIPEISKAELMIYLWVLLTYIFAFITIIIPKLRFLGEGEKYIKLVAIPTIYLSLLPLKYGIINYILFWIIWVLLFIISILEYYYENRINIKSKEISYNRSDLDDIIEYINGSKIDKLLCIPNNYSDSISYHCRISTLWGGHNQPMVEKLEDFFPILKKSLEEFKEKYEVNNLLLDTNYCEPKYLNLNDENIVYKKNHLVIYKID
jgi:hypothetical protein